MRDACPSSFCPSTLWHLDLPSTLRLSRQLADDFTLEQGATIGSSAVAAFHVLVNELKLDIPLDPWATDEAYVSKDADKPILLLGGSTSTAFYAIQVGICRFSRFCPSLS